MDTVEPISHVGEPRFPVFMDATSPGTPDPAWCSFKAARAESVTFIWTALPLVIGKGLPDLATATGPSETTTLPAAFDTTEYGGNELMVLEMAAERGNEAAFLEAAGKIDWSKRPAVDFARAVRLALAAGAHLFARNLAARGAERYPDHAELKKMAYILAPPRVARTGLPSVPSLRANQDWLQTHGEEHRGQWVALRNGALLAAASTAREVWCSLETKDDILITKVY
jgi:hypothetical protein